RAGHGRNPGLRYRGLRGGRRRPPSRPAGRESAGRPARRPARHTMAGPRRTDLDDRACGTCIRGRSADMTTRPVRGVEIAEVDEAAVASYLAATPEFFDRHAQLLAKIRLPDARGGGSTVS